MISEAKTVISHLGNIQNEHEDLKSEFIIKGVIHKSVFIYN